MHISCIAQSAKLLGAYLGKNVVNIDTIPSCCLIFHENIVGIWMGEGATRPSICISKNRNASNTLLPPHF